MIDELREKHYNEDVGVMTHYCIVEMANDHHVSRENMVSGEGIVSGEDAVKKTRSGNVYLMEEDKKKDTVGTYWMSIDKNECFDDEITVLVVKVPKKYHGRSES